MSRRTLVIAALALALVVGSVMLVAFSPSVTLPSPSPSPSPRSSTPVVPSPTIATGVVIEPLGMTTIVPHDPVAHPVPLAESPQRRIWWAGGRWWAVLPDAGSKGWQMLAASGPTGPWTTQGLIDDRRRISLDVAVRGDALLVVAAGIGGTRDQLVARRYRLEKGRYVLVADSPIPVTPRGVRRLSVAYAPDGAAWIAFVEDERLYVVRGPTGGTSWDSPQELAGESVGIEPTLVSLVGTDAGIALAWTATGADRLWIQRRAADAWTETSVEVGGEVTGSLSTAAIPGSPDVLALVGIHTTGAGQAPSTILVRAPPVGDLSVALVARDADRLRTPVLALAPDAAAALVFAMVRSASGSNTLVVKAAPLDTLAFPSGQGAPVLGGLTGDAVRDPLVPAVASPEGEIVVVGVREEPRELRAATLLVGAVPVPEVSEPLADADAVGLVRLGFDASKRGRAPSGWVRPGNASVGSIEVAGTSSERFLRLASARRGAARACFEFGGAIDGKLAARMQLRINRVGTADTWVAIRGRGDAAGILFDDDQTIAYRSGDTKLPAGSRYALGRWYLWEVQVDVAAGRYSWTLSADRGKVVAHVSDVPWGIREAAPIDTICMEVPAGRGPPSLDMDGLVVDHLVPPPP